MTILFDDQPVNPIPVSAKTDYIVDVDAKNFMAEVIEASRERLVIVDFWAPWCGPCKQLVPALEKQVMSHKGAVRLAKINIDANPQIAGQLHVQTVPTIFAFFQGQPVDGFTGAVPESQLKNWIDRLVTATGSLPPGKHNGPNIEEALQRAEKALSDGDIETARLLYTDILKQSPMEARAFAGTLRCLLTEGKASMASEILSQAHPELQKNKALNPIRAALDMAKESEKATGDLNILIEKVALSPHDLPTRFDLAMACYAAKDYERSVSELLEIVRQDRKWNDEAARKQLVKLFDIFGPNDPLTVIGRKRLSSILFS